MRKLIGEGAGVKARDGRGVTALLAATHGNHVEAARLLIAAGADVNAKDNMDDTPFLYAGAEGRNEILKMTLAAGADLKSTNRYGGTALDPGRASRPSGDGENPAGDRDRQGSVNKLGWTALLEAVILGDGGKTHTEIVRLLVEAGANPNIADRDGVTPLAHAKKRGYTAMIAYSGKSRARSGRAMPPPFI